MPIHDGPVILDMLTGFAIAFSAAMGGLLWVFVLARPERRDRRRESAHELAPGPIDLVVVPRPEPARAPLHPARTPVDATPVATPVESSPVL